MFKKLLKKLASDLILESYIDGFNNGELVGYKKAKEEMVAKNKGAFKKGHTPWNKGLKKGVKNGK